MMRRMQDSQGSGNPPPERDSGWPAAAGGDGGAGQGENQAPGSGAAAAITPATGPVATPDEITEPPGGDAQGPGSAWVPGAPGGAPDPLPDPVSGPGPAG